MSSNTEIMYRFSRGKNNVESSLSKRTCLLDMLQSPSRVPPLCLRPLVTFETKTSTLPGDIIPGPSDVVCL